VLILDVFPVGPIQANCVIVGDSESKKAAVIDPGADGSKILERLRVADLEPGMVLHTHGHLDHAAGTGELVAAVGDSVPIGLHRDDLELYRSLTTQGQMFGLDVQTAPEPTLWFEHGQQLTLGSFRLEVRHTPGHSPGGVSFVLHGADEPVVIVGDVLFAGSIGRTDLWGGSFQVLEQSILQQLYSLPGETRVICGHGPDTTIDRERRTNPFVKG